MTVYMGKSTSCPLLLLSLRYRPLLSQATLAYILFFFFHSVLHWSVNYCVHNAPPVVTNSCLPPGRSDQIKSNPKPLTLNDQRCTIKCKASVPLAKVCLHCTKPGVAWSSWLSLPIWRQPPDHRSDSTVVVLLWWAAGNMSKEPQTSVSDQVGERMASGGCSDFHIRHMAGVLYPRDLA